MSGTWQRRCSGNVFTTSCFDSRCWNLRPPRNINGMKVDIGILRKGDGPQEWSECIELTSQLLGGCWRMQTCKQLPHLYPMVVHITFHMVIHGKITFIWKHSRSDVANRLVGSLHGLKPPIASEAFSSHPKLTAFGSGKLCYKLYNFQSFGHTKKNDSSFCHSLRLHSKTWQSWWAKCCR